MKSLFRMCLIGAAILLAGRSELAQANWDHCQSYENSRVVSSYQWGTYCGSTGNGCTYCWDDGLGDYCYGNFGSGCGIDHQNF